MQYLYGMHPVMEAIKCGRKFEKVLLKQGLDSRVCHDLLQLMGENGIPYQFVPVEKLNRIAKGTHQGVVALTGTVDYVDIDTLVAGALARTDSPVVMLLDGVSDVRNLGAIARSLEVSGGQGIVLPAKGGAPVNAEAVKASSGALMRLPCSKVTSLREAVFCLKDAGFRIVAASEKAEKSMWDADLTGPVAVIMGSEGRGISKNMLSLSDEMLKIPQIGEIGSLNVSVASALIAFEALRQKTIKKKYKEI